MFIVGVYFKKCRVSSLIFSCIQGSQIVGGYHNIVTSSTNSPDFGSCFLIDIGWNGTTYNVHVSEVIVSTFKFIKSHCHYNLLVAFIAKIEYGFKIIQKGNVISIYLIECIQGSGEI